MSKVNELSDKIKNSLPQLSILVANAEAVGTQQALGDVLNRIFTLNRNSSDGQIGKYVLGPYKRKRQAKGFQVSQIDLQFTGDLFNSIGVGQLNGKPAVGIFGTLNSDKANNIEKNYGPIFQASKIESEKSIDSAKEFLFSGIIKLMESWS